MLATKPRFNRPPNPRRYPQVGLSWRFGLKGRSAPGGSVSPTDECPKGVPRQACAAPPITGASPDPNGPGVASPPAAIATTLLPNPPLQPLGALAIPSGTTQRQAKTHQRERIPTPPVER